MANVEMFYRLEQIVTEIEASYRIDGMFYEEEEYNRILSGVKRNIQREYQIDLSVGKLDNKEYDISPSGSAVRIFLENIASLHSRLCGSIQIMRYHTKTEVSLLNIKYLTITEDCMENILLCLQRKRTILSVDEAVNTLKQKVVNVNTTIEKRLFIIMLISYDLGIYEMVSAIAEVLFLGGI